MFLFVFSGRDTLPSVSLQFASMRSTVPKCDLINGLCICLKLTVVLLRQCGELEIGEDQRFPPTDLSLLTAPEKPPLTSHPGSIIVSNEWLCAAGALVDSDHVKEGRVQVSKTNQGIPS